MITTNFEGGQANEATILPFPFPLEASVSEATTADTVLTDPELTYPEYWSRHGHVELNEALPQAMQQIILYRKDARWLQANFEQNGDPEAAYHAAWFEARWFDGLPHDRAHEQANTVYTKIVQRNESNDEIPTDAIVEPATDPAYVELNDSQTVEASVTQQGKLRRVMRGIGRLASKL